MNTMTPIVAVYSDAGLIGASASPECLGTYAWVHVGPGGDGRLGERLAYGSGVQPAFGSRPLENNAAELAALLRGLRALPDGWSGDVFCDNRNALGWAGLIVKGDGSAWKTDGVPEEMARYLPKVLARLGPLRGVLLDGHPTDAHLAAGAGKRGGPVSPFNRFCDDHCRAARAKWELESGLAEPFRLTAAEWGRLTPGTRGELLALGYAPPRGCECEPAECDPVTDAQDAQNSPDLPVSGASAPAQGIVYPPAPETAVETAPSDLSVCVTVEVTAEDIARAERDVDGGRGDRKWGTNPLLTAAARALGVDGFDVVQDSDAACPEFPVYAFRLFLPDGGYARPPRRAQYFLSVWGYGPSGGRDIRQWAVRDAGGKRVALRSYAEIVAPLSFTLVCEYAKAQDARRAAARLRASSQYQF